MEYSILYSIFRSKIKRILINKIEFIFDLEFRSVGKLFQTSKSGKKTRHAVGSHSVPSLLVTFLPFSNPIGYRSALESGKDLNLTSFGE